MEKTISVILEGDEGTRLDRFIRRNHPQVNQGRIEKLLRGGVIRVDGAKAKSSLRLKAGMEVSMPKTIINIDRVIKEKTVQKSDPKIVKKVREALITKGEGWIALNKPSGLATQGGTGTKHHVDGVLKEAFPEFEKLRLVHRLDRDTSGLLVIATELSMSRHLAQGFQDHSHEKTYLALIVGAPKVKQGKINAPLLKSGGKGSEKMIVDDQGQNAITLYRVIEQLGNKVSLVAMRPLTGRTHQLRAHMAYLGCPILGDGKYGGSEAFPNDEIERLCLHAAAIKLDIRNNKMKSVTANLPDDIKSLFTFFGFNADQALKIAAHPNCFKET